MKKNGSRASRGGASKFSDSSVSGSSEAKSDLWQRMDQVLDDALNETFPASDPIAIGVSNAKQE